MAPLRVPFPLAFTPELHPQETGPELHALPKSNIQAESGCTALATVLCLLAERLRVGLGARSLRSPALAFGIFLPTPTVLPNRLSGIRARPRSLLPLLPQI